MATTATNSTVIGVFPDYDQANNAIDGLRHSRFSYDRIRLVQHGTGGFADTLKSMFTGQASMASDTSNVLVKMGMPEYEAQHYQSELDTNHVLLLMNADERPEEALNIMRQSGAFDITLRLRMALPDASAATPTQTAAYTNNAQGAYNQAPVQTAPNANTPQAAFSTNSSQKAYNQNSEQVAAYANNPREEYHDPRMEPHNDGTYGQSHAGASASEQATPAEVPQEDEDTAREDQTR